MSNFELLLMIRRFRWHYIFIFFSSTIIGGYFIIPDVLYYKGESSFYMANESLVDPNLFGKTGQENVLQVSVMQERAIQFAYSTEMMQHLIKQFNLYEHYDIDTASAYHFELAVDALTGSIRFNKLTNDLSSIIVFDRNNEMASSMANAMVWKLDELNKKYLTDKIQTNLNFYESYLNESLRISKGQNENLNSYMKTLSEHRRSGNAQTLSEVEFSIFQAVTNINEVTGQLILVRNLYQNALTLRQTNNLPSIVIVKKAIPDLESKKPILALFAGLIGVISLIVSVILTYIYFAYTKELQILFGYKLPESIDDKKKIF